MTADGLFSVVLAAGTASRFGSPKQLARYRGAALVQRAIDLAGQTTGSNSVLVVGSEWRRVVDGCIPFDGFFTLNEAFEQGMSGSIACGIRSVRHVARAALILLADQPLITAAHLQQLKTAWQRDDSAIVASAYAGIAGPPVIFPAAYFPQLLALREDRGARMIIERHRSAVTTVRFENAGVDIDTPDDLQKL